MVFHALIENMIALPCVTSEHLVTSRKHTFKLRHFLSGAELGTAITTSRSKIISQINKKTKTKMMKTKIIVHIRIYFLVILKLFDAPWPRFYFLAAMPAARVSLFKHAV